MQRRSFFSLALLFLSLSACTAAAPDDPGLPLAASSAAIVGGQNESGWEGVGALTGEYIGWGYQGSFCSGSLIAPQWVLTAAHCISDEGDRPVMAETTLFYVGPNANPNGFGVGPATGTLHRANAVYVHPAYNPPMTVHDIGLVHLAEPVEGVPIYPINTTPFEQGSFVGDDAFYVGFGVTSGVTNRGSGFKRSTSIEIRSFYDNYYSSYSEGSGVCFGDSGGPGLIEREGEWRIIGVNSTVASASNDPCDGYSNQTRVDAYADWVLSHVEGDQPDCRRDPSLCWCDEACQRVDGSCDNSVCRNLSCRGGAECMRRCNPGDQSCYVRCGLNATEEDESQLREFYLCVILFCRRAEGAERDACIAQNCEGLRSECYDIPEGEESCRSVFDCAIACDARDISCEETCYFRGSQQARESYDSIMDCSAAACDDRWLTDWSTGELYDQDAWNTCFYAACGEAVDECRRPVPCSPLGGDCPQGQACAVTATGSTDCFPSARTGAAFGCVPGQETRGCADGLACVEDDKGFLCQRMCLADADCPEGVACEAGLFPGDESVGVCWCRDDDRDGVCAALDCDDQEMTVYPGAVERCFDGLDNDCDGETDEGCDDCVDADGDGYCADVDCDDNNPGIRPGPIDICGDGIDGNCNGEVDEGCPERCEDADGDGYCAEVECDDTNPAIHPGAPEICGDGLDNNCDGQVDEGCPAPEVTDGGGACSAAGGPSPVAPMALLMLLLLFVATARCRTSPCGRSGCGAARADSARRR